MPPMIAILPGDGVGPEVVAEARRVLLAVSARLGKTLTFDEGLLGGIAIDRVGTALPTETVELCRSADAVLLGAVGGPKWDDPSASVRPEQGLRYATFTRAALCLSLRTKRWIFGRLT